MRPITDNNDPSQEGYFNNPHLNTVTPSSSSYVASDQSGNSATPQAFNDDSNSGNNSGIANDENILNSDESGNDLNQVSNSALPLEADTVGIPIYNLEDESKVNDSPSLELEDSEIQANSVQEIPPLLTDEHSLSADEPVENPLDEIASVSISDDPIDEVASLPLSDDPLAENATLPINDEPLVENSFIPINEEPNDSEVEKELTKAEQIALIASSVNTDKSTTGTIPSDTDDKSDDKSMFSDSSDDAPRWHMMLLIVGILFFLGASSATGVFGFMVFDKMGESETSVPVSNNLPSQVIEDREVPTDEQDEEEVSTTDENPSAGTTETEEGAPTVQETTEVFPDQKQFENSDLLVYYPNEWVLEEDAGTEGAGLLFQSPDDSEGSLLISYAPSSTLLAGEEPDCSEGVDITSSTSEMIYRRVQSLSTEQFKSYLVCESTDGGETFIYPKDRDFYFEINGRSDSVYTIVDKIIANMELLSE